MTPTRRAFFDPDALGALLPLLLQAASTPNTVTAATTVAATFHLVVSTGTSMLVYELRDGQRIFALSRARPLRRWVSGLDLSFMTDVALEQC